METIEDWNGDAVAIRRSRGSSVPYVEDWRRNVVGLPDAPPAWLIRQVRGYVAQPSWFQDEDAEALAVKLGRISKFQSLRSEDALTWSWFGSLALASGARRREAIDWLCEQLGSPRGIGHPEIRQWERVLHPNEPGRRGPEIDATVDDAGGTLIYVEAKWLADLGTGRGADEGSRDDQVTLRRDSFRKDPALSEDERTFVVLVLGLNQGDPGRYAELDASLRKVMIKWMSWEQLAACPAHPHADEFARHLEWKHEHG